MSVTDSEDEVIDDENALGGPSGTGGTYQPVTYVHYAEVDYSSLAGYTWITDVRISPTTLYSASSPFVDSYGYSGIREVALYNHTNSKFYLIPPLVRITWQCNVIGIYHTTDLRNWTYGWVHTHTKTV